MDRIVNSLVMPEETQRFMLRRLQSSSRTATVDQNLAVYIYIFLGGMTLVGIISLLVYCYHQRKLQTLVEMDNRFNNMQRFSLVDSFIESGESEWQCSVCYHENHPAKTECLMCGTPQVISAQAVATPKLGSRSGSSSSLLSPSSLDTNLQAARQRSFHVRRLNQMNLNQRQKSARRRHLWQRGKGADGQLRWFRTEDCQPRNSTITDKEDLGFTSLKIDEAEDHQPPLAGAITNSSTLNNNETLLSMSSGVTATTVEDPNEEPRASGVRTGPSGENLVAQASVGFVRHVDESDGTVSWVPADSVDLPEETVDTEEFPRASVSIDFESVAALPFRIKVRWFLQELDRVAVPWEDGHLLLKIRRDAVTQESIHLLMLVPASDIRQRLRIEFIEEPGLDAGGLMREWVLLLCQEMFEESYGLFKATHVENLSYWINPSSASVNGPEHLKCFEFIGRLIAKCLLEGQLLTVHFALPLLKHILGVPISFSDLEFLDEELYRNAIWIRENQNVESLCLDFTAQRQDDATGEMIVVELKPGGADIAVTDDNKEEYLELLLRYRMFDGVSEQISAIIRGLFDVIPRTLLAVFDYQELELLLCGVPDIDMDDWIRHTDVKYLDYENPTKGEKKLVSWFWDAVTAFSQEERARLLQFVTGTSRVPVEGFKALMSNDGRVRRFGIQVVQRGTPPAGLYPKAHTCFNRIDIPFYNSKEELETYLTLVINMEITGFTMQGIWYVTHRLATNGMGPRKKVVKATGDSIISSSPVSIADMPQEDLVHLMSLFKDFVERNPQTCRAILHEQEDLTRALALGQLRLGMFKLSNKGGGDDDDALDELESPVDSISTTSASPSILTGLDAEQQELLSTVQNMTPATFATIPTEQQTQIRALRSALGLKPL